MVQVWQAGAILPSKTLPIVLAAKQKGCVVSAQGITVIGTGEKVLSDEDNTSRNVQVIGPCGSEPAADMGCCSCCSCRAFVVIMQIFLGLALTTLCVYLHLYMPLIRLRETPFWAAIPLLLAGLLGIGFLFKSNNKRRRIASCLFILQISSVVCAAIAIFTCVTSMVFITIHMVRLFTYAYCRHLPNGCLCFDSEDTSQADAFLYSPVESCFPVFCEMKIFISSIGGLCLLGSVFALSYVVSVWQSIYGNTSRQPSSAQDYHDLSQSPSEQYSSATPRPQSAGYP